MNESYYGIVEVAALKKDAFCLSTVLILYIFLLDIHQMDFGFT